MFNRDALFGKKDEPPRTNEPRSSVNVTPGLGGSNPPVRNPAGGHEQPKPDLRFAEVPRPQPQSGRADDSAGSRLIVGPDIKLKGVEITDCDTLVVEGRVEASMDSRVIQIAENGVFSGTVSIDVAEIRGRFEGALTARKQLVIHSTGRVSGQIRYGKIRIEEGGELSGEISTLAAEPVAAVAAAPAAASATPTGPAANAASAAPAAAASAAAPTATAPATAVPAAANSAALQAAVSSALHAPRPTQPAGLPSIGESNASRSAKPVSGGKPAPAAGVNTI